MGKHFVQALKFTRSRPRILTEVHGPHSLTYRPLESHYSKYGPKTSSFVTTSSEVQNLGPHLRPEESEFAFYKIPW